MKENFTQVSERLRKYLIRIKYRNEYYFTVFGSDLKDQEVDKLLIDGNNNLLLFVSRDKLKMNLKKGNLPFDRKNLSEWAFFLSPESEVYQDLDLDSLVKITEGIEWVNLAFKMLGVIEDYARQVNDDKLLNIIDGDVLSLFKDSVSDIVIWGKSHHLEKKDSFASELKKIYEKIQVTLA